MNIPDFTKLTHEHHDYLKPYFANQHYDLCVYSLDSIIAWQNGHFGPCFRVEDDTLVLAVWFDEHFQEESHMILPISPNGDIPPKEIRRLTEEYGFSKCSLVPGDYMEKFGEMEIGKYFSIEEQTKMEDYVYNTEDLANLKGNKYSKKRNLINQFKKTHVSKGRVEVTEIRKQDVPECEEFLEKWCEERECDKSPGTDLECERQAALNALRLIGETGFKGLLLRVDNTVSAFGIASRLTDEMGVLHFEKAFANIKGLYQYFDRECARRLFKGFRFINKESDMNIPGLAKAKKSYYPVRMVKSFKLCLN